MTDEQAKLQREWEWTYKTIEQDNLHIRFLNESKRSMKEWRCRAILTYSSSAIGLSILLLKFDEKIVPDNWLFASWVMLAIAIVLIVISYEYGMKSLSVQMEAISCTNGEESLADNANGENVLSSDTENASEMNSTYIYLASRFFIAGVGLFVIFAIKLFVA